MFVLFDPVNSPEALKSKLKDFLGEQTEQFVEWFSKVISQVDNQVAKGTHNRFLLPSPPESFLTVMAVLLVPFCLSCMAVQAGEVADTAQTSKEASVERTKRSQSREDTSTSARPSNHTPTPNPKSIKGRACNFGLVFLPGRED